MDFERAKKYLESFISYEGVAKIPYGDKAFDLERIRKFLREWGVDYQRLKYVHVAGSKGKGTTCSFIANYLWKSGYKVGLYTSPHLIDVTERIWLDGKDIDRLRFAESVNELKEFIEKSVTKNGRDFLPVLTYFEILTVLALKYFVDENVDYAILEVGLGGRLDATNVVTPALSIITNVELEHVGILGNNLSEIVDEKLGIVKDGVPVLIGNGGALKLIRQKLKGKKELFYVSEFEVQFSAETFSDKARFDNAHLAFAAAEILLGKVDSVAPGRRLTSLVDSEKFLKMVNGLKLPGRVDVRKISGKEVVFDVAHTKNSIQNLVDSLKKKFLGGKYVFLMSLMKGKDVKSILKIVDTVAEKIVFTNAHDVRGINAEELAKQAKKGRLQSKIEVVDNCILAFENLVQKKNQLLVVTGSHFLVGKLLKQ